MRLIPRFLSILLLLILTACGAIIRFDNLSIELPDAPATSTLTVIPSPTASPTITASPTAISTNTITTLVNLNLRGAASINSPILVVIPASTTIQLFGRSADSAWLAVQYGTRQGWVSSANNLIRINGGILSSLPIISQLPIIPSQDPTPTQERPKSRISYNINGEGVPNEAYLLEVLSSPCKTMALVMNNLALAVRIKQLCPDMLVVSRNYSSLEGDEWFYRSPQNIIAQWQREGHPEIIRHSTNEPSFGGARIAQFVAADIEVMRLARSAGFTLAMGNFSVGIIQPYDINNGVFDLYIRALVTYGHYLGLHEYAVVALPYGVGQWQTSLLQDRANVQPASWPTLLALPMRLWNGALPPYWYLRRGDWWLLRADFLGVARPRILLTEFGWDNLPNIKPEIEVLRNRFGMDRYFDDMRGINTYQNLWPYYWPQWTFAQAACEQLKWADSIYPPEYLGFALFTWSASRDWAQTDFSGRENSQLYDLHDCLQDYAA